MEKDERIDWGLITTEQVGRFFEPAYESVPGFVVEELRAFDQNLVRAVQLDVVLEDVFALADMAAAGELKWPTLASSRRLAKTFGRWCVSPASLRVLSRDVFVLMRDALARKRGEDVARTVTADRYEAFAPSLARAEDILARGPLSAQVVGSPATYLLAPLAWGTFAIFAGDRRREREESREDFARALGDAAGVQLTHRPTRKRVLSVLAALALTTGAVAVGASAAFQVIDFEELYLAHLEEVEEILLHGGAGGIGLIEAALMLQKISKE